MILVLPNQYARESTQRLIRDGFAIATRRCGERNVNVVVPTLPLKNVVELRRKQR